MKWQANCADEFDVTGFTIITVKEYEEYGKLVYLWQKALDDCIDNYDDYDDYEISVSVGNSSLCFRDSEDLDREITEMLVTKEEARAVRKVFGDSIGIDIFSSEVDKLSDLLK